MAFGVVVEGISDLDEIKDLRQNIRFAAVRAINTTTRDTRATAAKRIGEQINLPKRQLGPAGGRLTVSGKATRTKLEGKITARGRPTSLAQFSRGSPGKIGVSVEVKPGQARFMRRAFLIKLPQGSALTDTKFNLGLAIRLRPGERLDNKVRQVQLSKGLYLLYGPSIQQVFLNNKGEGVADDLAEPTSRKLEAEFLRLLNL